MKLEPLICVVCDICDARECFQLVWLSALLGGRQCSWSTFRASRWLVVEIKCIDDLRASSQHETRALLIEHGYTFFHRERANEIWGDMSVDWVRSGSLALTGGMPQTP